MDILVNSHLFKLVENSSFYTTIDKIDIRIIFFKLLRRLIRPLFQGDKYKNTNKHTSLDKVKANSLIYEILRAKSPCFIGRFGKSELTAMLVHWHKKSKTENKSWKYLKGEIYQYWWEADKIDLINKNAGVFPREMEIIEQYCELMLEDCKNIDILGSWLGGEKDFFHLFPTSKKVSFIDLEPYRHKKPWSKALENQKVLIIHPFEKTILHQYQRRKLLFEYQNVLPNFEIKTIKAVQSIAGNQPEGFNDWFEALDSMKRKIDKVNFDIAIIGCGAYGFPLAAYVKRIGKKAVHLGGATQILFGIKGQRWDSDPFVSKLYNEHWIRPLKDDIPKNHESIEGGCYW